MSNRSVTYSLSLNNSVITSLQQTESQAKRVDNAMSSLQQTMNALKIGYIGSRLLGEAQEWVQTASTYEQAMLRIKFGSQNLQDGLKNQKFILEEVNKFKIPLQDATDAYGQFLAQVRSSGLAGNDIRKLHDEILLVGKVLHLPDNMVNQAVNNLGKMLEAGRVDSRHLVPFTQELSGIAPFIAKQMGLTMQQYGEFRSKGKFAKENIDPKIILGAVEEYSKQFQKDLPEALQSTQSSLNELNNEWEKFKINTVLVLKPELITFLHDIGDGIKYLADHRQDLIEFVKHVGEVVEFIVKWKLAQGALSLILNTRTSFFAGFKSSTIAQTEANVAQTASVNSLAAAIERLNFVQNAQNGNFIKNAEGGLVANTVGNRYAMTAEQRAAAGAGSTAAIGGASSIMTTAGAAILVYLAAESISSIADLISDHNKYVNATPEEKYDIDKNRSKEAIGEINQLFGTSSIWTAFNQEKDSDRVRNTLENLIKTQPQVLQDQKYIDEIRRVIDLAKNQELTNIAKSEGFTLESERIRPLILARNMFFDQMDQLFNVSVPQFKLNMFGIPYQVSDMPIYPTPDGKPVDRSGDVSSISHSGSPKVPKSSAIKGNSVTNITITIPEMNGMKQCTFQVKNMHDMDKIRETVGAEMTRQLTSAVNDSQHVARQH